MPTHGKDATSRRVITNEIIAFTVIIAIISDAEFSHGICPECAKKLYPDLELYKKKK